MERKLKDKLIARIRQLFDEAEEARHRSPELAKHYVILARKLSLKTRAKIPRELKRRFCRHCFAYFVPGHNYTVRTTGKTVTYTCKSCKRWMRFGYKKKSIFLLFSV